jgi:hypothetical protein
MSPEMPRTSRCRGYIPGNSRRVGAQEDRKLTDFSRERRDLLCSAAAWVSGVVALAATRSAGAWQVQEMDPAGPLGLAYAKRCGGPSNHAALVARLKAQLAEDSSASSLTATCAICGCPITVDR